MIHLSPTELTELITLLTMSVAATAWHWISENRDRKNSWILLFLLLCVSGSVLFVTVDTTPKQAFGEFSPLMSFGLMYLGVCLGIAANTIFVQPPPYKWYAFIRPLMISPIPLIPLKGSMDWESGLDTSELINFLLASFGSGFFWKSILSRVKKDLVNDKPSNEKSDVYLRS